MYVTWNARLLHRVRVVFVTVGSYWCLAAYSRQNENMNLSLCLLLIEYSVKALGSRIEGCLHNSPCSKTGTWQLR